MKLANANKIRKQYIEELLTYFRCDGSSDGEDCGMITSNSFNFPVVADDGEEGWVEIVVKIPKEDEGYEKREEFQMKMKKKEEKKQAQAESKAKKIERDKKMCEERKHNKQEKNVLGTTFCTYCGSNERKVYNDESETADSTNGSKYYKTFCPNCGQEGSILKQSFNKINEQKGK